MSHVWLCINQWLLLSPLELSKRDPGKALSHWEGAGGEHCHKSEGSPSHLIHPALSCRMDSFEDKLQQLREAFREGRTRSAEFRAAQLQGLSHFLRDNKQQLQEALAQDLHKVAWNRDSGVGVCVPRGQQGWYNWDKEHGLGTSSRKRS